MTGKVVKHADLALGQSLRWPRIYLGSRVIVLASTPGRIIETIDLNPPRPRDHLTTREHPELLSHRHQLFGLLQDH